jgi:hypothetical protein
MFEGRSTDRFERIALPSLLIALSDLNLALVNPRKVFGDVQFEGLEPQHIYRYVDTRLNKQGQKSPATGVHEARMFKQGITKAVE